MRFCIGAHTHSVAIMAARAPATAGARWERSGTRARAGGGLHRPSHQARAAAAQPPLEASPIRQRFPKRLEIEFSPSHDFQTIKNRDDTGARIALYLRFVCILLEMHGPCNDTIYRLGSIIKIWVVDHRQYWPILRLKDIASVVRNFQRIP